MTKPTKSTELLGAVLCGGRSSRMGADKAALSRPDGLTQREHMTELLRPLCHRIVVSERYDDQALEQPDIVRDRIREAGPAAGIAACLAVAGLRNCASVLFVPVDLPQLDTKVLAKIVAAGQTRMDQVIVATDTLGRRQPLVSLWPIRFADEAAQWAHGSDRSLHGLLTRLPAYDLVVETDSLLNTNTTAEWQDWYDRELRRGMGTSDP